jgi:hypothetical protein
VAAVAMAAAAGKVIRLWRHYFGQIPGLAFASADYTDLRSRRLSHYYVQARGENAEHIEAGRLSGVELGPDGVPRVDYGGAMGKQFNPVTIGLYALENWERYLNADDTQRRERFLRQAEWLVAEQDQGRWYYRFDADVLQPGLRNPWASAMAQSLGISVLLRAWQLTDDTRYSRAVQEAFGVFAIPFAQGGVVCPCEGGVWLEEFPDAATPSHVLNGHMWSLFGLWDYWRALADGEAKRLFDAGIAGLVRNLGKYDNGYWVCYSRRPHPPLVNSAYLHFQIDQLRVLEAISGERALGEYAARWEGYHRNGWGFVRILARGAGEKVRRLSVRLKRGTRGNAVFPGVETMGRETAP